MSRDNVELVRQIYRQMETRDYARAGELFDPDVVLVRIGDEFADLAGEWHGRDELWAVIKDYFRTWEDLRHDLKRIIDLGDRVLLIAMQTARGRQSGVMVEHEGAFLYTFREGRVVRVDAYRD